MSPQTEKIFLWILLLLIVALLFAWGNWARTRSMAEVTSRAWALGLTEEEGAARLNWQYLASGTVNGFLMSIGVRRQEGSEVAIVAGAPQSPLGRIMVRPLIRSDSAFRSARRILTGDAAFDPHFVMAVLDADGRPSPGDPLGTALADAAPRWLDEAVRNGLCGIRGLQLMLVTDDRVSVQLAHWRGADLDTAIEIVSTLTRWPQGPATGARYR